MSIVVYFRTSGLRGEVEGPREPCLTSVCWQFGGSSGDKRSSKLFDTSSIAEDEMSRLGTGSIRSHDLDLLDRRADGLAPNRAIRVHRVDGELVCSRSYRDRRRE